MFSKQAGTSKLVDLFSSENLKNMSAADIAQAKEDVSPDRKAIYEESMKKTGGKMNGACMFWNHQGSKTLSYNPESGNWKAISTEAEFERARKFTAIYNDEIKRLSNEYGERAKVQCNQYSTFTKTCNY